MTYNPEDYAPTAWGNKVSMEKDLVLSSGQKCRVRKLEMEDILELDILDVMDTFTSQLVAEPDDNKNSDPMEMLKLLKDSDRREKLMSAINRVIPVTVVAPQVLPDPEPGRPKKPGHIYISMIDLVDKMEIFGAAFDGWGDVTGFREETQESLGAVAES